MIASVLGWIDDESIVECRRLSFATQVGGALLPLGTELQRFHLTLRSEDGGLLLTFGLEHGGLLPALCAVDRRLLLTFRLQDRRTLVLFGFLLFGHRLEHVGRWGDVENLDAVEPHSPLEAWPPPCDPASWS